MMQNTPNNTTWRNNADFDDDLLAISDICNRSTFRKHEPNEVVRQARCKPSIYYDQFPTDDIDDDENEDTNESFVNYFGRGRGTFNKDKRKPGGTPSFLNHQKETTKEIRQVDAFGSSNEITLHYIKSKQKQDKEPITDYKYHMPDIRLTSPTTTISSSSSSSSSIYFTPRSSTELGQIGDGVKETPTASKENTPPLYDILQFGRQTGRNSKNLPKMPYQTGNSFKTYNENSTVEEPIPFIAPTPPELNIYSTMDFPKLS